MAHETLHSIIAKKVPSIIVKLDMMKAYNKVNWSFLRKVMFKFGFSTKWCRWIITYLSRAKFSMIINGSPTSFISASQGVR